MTLYPSNSVQRLEQSSGGLLAEIVRYGESSFFRSCSGLDGVLRRYLGDASIAEFIAIRSGDVDALEQERSTYSPVAWRSIVSEYRAEIDGVYNCAKSRDRHLIRDVWLQLHDMSDWHLFPMWGEPDATELFQLRLSHEGYFGRQTPQMVLDEYQRKSRRRARERVFAASEYACVKCGDRRRLVIDHIVPIMRGGLNYGLNFQALCHVCNTTKRTHVWWPAMPDGVEERFPLRDAYTGYPVRSKR